MPLDSMKHTAPQEFQIPEGGTFKIIGSNGQAILTVTAEGKTGQGSVAPVTLPLAALSAAAVAAASFTHTAPGGDDFAVQALTQTSPFGFVTADEGHSVLKALKNAILRIEELQARLVSAGIITA